MLARLAIIIILWGITCKSIAQDHDLIISDTFSTTFLQEKYLALSIDHLLDNFIEEIVVQQETNSNFSRIDDLLYSIEGNSYQWNKMYYNDQRIDNPLAPGTSFMKPVLLGHKLSLDRVNKKIMLTKKKNQKLIRFQLDNGHLGGRLPSSDEIVNAIYGHKSSFQRARGPLPFRKKIDFQIDFHASFLNEKSFIPELNLQVLSGQRKHISHDYRGINGYDAEKYVRIDLNGQLNLLNTKWQFLSGFLYRNQYGAEWGYNSQETSTLHRYYSTVFTNSTTDSKKWHLGINVLWQYEKLNSPGYSKNIIDQDGQIFESWKIPNHVASIFQYGSFAKNVSSTFSVFGEAFNGIIRYKPKNNQLNFPIYYQSTEDAFRPMYVNTLKSESFTSALLENELGLKAIMANDFLEWTSSLYFSFDGMALKVNSKYSLNWNVDSRIKFTLSDRFEVLLELSKTRAPYHYNHVKFLSTDYHWGSLYSWQDDGDRIFDAGEKGNLIKKSGGRIHEFSGNEKQANIYRISIPLVFHLSDWRLGLNSTYKSFRNSWSVAYDQLTDQNSWSTPFGNTSLFYINPDAEVRYNIVPLAEEKLEEATGRNSIFFNQPFYASILAYLAYQSENWFLYSSFQAFMVIGFGGIGNGPIHNNIDALSESLANPNTYIHYLGRLDSDRSFVGRLLLSKKINKTLSMALQVKYKDGQPFNYFNIHLFQDEQFNARHVIWNQGIKGDNPFTGEFNTRTDGLWNWEFRLSFIPSRYKERLKLQLFFYNIFDLGMEISEFNFLPAQTSERAPLQLEVPRGMSISLLYKWN